MDPQGYVDQFLLDHFREDFISEVEAILKADNKEGVVGIVQYDGNYLCTITLALLNYSFFQIASPEPAFARRSLTRWNPWSPDQSTPEE